MKKSVVLAMMIVLLFFLSPTINSQGVKVDVKGKVIQQADSRANQRTDQAISYGYDKLEQGIVKGVKGIFKKKDKAGNAGDTATQANEAEESEAAAGNEQNQQAASAQTTQDQPTLTWAKYDFVPGDEVIFEDNLLNEENGEFPSRWDLDKGNVEVAEFGGEKVIMFRGGDPTIVPYFKNPQEDHLPEIFTIEMDYYYPSGQLFVVSLYDWKNQRSVSPTGYTDIRIWGNDMSMGEAKSTYPDEKRDLNRWIHLSIAYTNGKLKVYFDDTRLINIPRLDFDPSGLTINVYHASNTNLAYVKNVRIAKGGVKYYDRVMQDGKIIVNGIRFDTGKATLKPESMGPINEIFNLMKNNTDLKFSVEGHTDSQGDDAFNMTLSQDRAATVMNKLIKMGISSDRLTSKGWGESKPISDNATPEGMANNRRVEFVKI